MPATKIKRSQLAAFINTGATSAKVWSRIGLGATEQTIGYNPQVTTETYIHEDSATTNVDSYQVNIPTPLTAYAGDPVFDFVDGIRKSRGVGSAAAVEVLLVYMYSGAPWEAELNSATIQVDDFGGEGGGSVVLNFTLNLNGDPVIGTAAIVENDLVFTPAD